MNNVNTPNTVSTQVNQLVENITQTCNALISALEVNAQSVGSYGGGIVQQFDSEFVDRIVKNLLKIKYHTAKIAKECDKGLITNPEELTAVVSGLLETVDQLDRILLEDGFMRNQFDFFINELKDGITLILEEIRIS
jgi:hypothetical protein